MAILGRSPRLTTPGRRAERRRSSLLRIHPATGGRLQSTSTNASRVRGASLERSARKTNSRLATNQTAGHGGASASRRCAPAATMESRARDRTLRTHTSVERRRCAGQRGRQPRWRRRRRASDRGALGGRRRRRPTDGFRPKHRLERAHLGGISGDVPVARALT